MDGFSRTIRAGIRVLLAACVLLAVFAEQDVTLFLILLFTAMCGVLALVIRRRRPR
jgi:hypothetical protein